jgi:hypothetical protein
MIVPALTFFRSPIGQYALTGAAVAVVLGGAYLTGRNHGHEATEGRWKGKMAQAEAKARVIEANGQAIAQALRQAHAAEVAEILAHREVVIQRIPRYVTAKADANCPVTTGVVSVLNAAVSGSELPSEPSGPVDADSGTSLSELTEVAAYNFTVANELRSEVVTWREWYRREAAAYGLRGPL